MSDAVKSKRPQFRNIHVLQIAGYRLPLAGILSILHRISGALMFVLLPFVLFLFEKSIASEESFDAFKATVSGICPRLLILALCWGYLHHFCAGIRHLCMDNHMGLDKDCARRSAAVVLVISLAMTALIALKLFDVFSGGAAHGIQ